MSTLYRDIDWIEATWLGNDLIALLVAVPLLLTVSLCIRPRLRTRSTALVGVLGYVAYNYTFYLFGAALNLFFLLYVLAVVALIVTLSTIDVTGLASSFGATAPVRAIGSCLVFGIGLASVWIGLWAAYVFAERRLPVEPEIFKLVAALDLSLIVPALTFGGVLLWRRSSCRSRLSRRA